MMRTRTLSEIALAISTDCWAASVRPRAGFRTSSETPSSARIASASRNISSPADHGAAVLVADENVLGDVEIGKQQRLLIDGGDAQPLRLGGAADRDRPAGQKDLAAIRLMHAGYDLDERRFAGAVLAEQGVNLAGMKRERDVIERLRGVKALGDAANLQDRRDRRRAVRGFLRLGHSVSARRLCR